jgi:HSP20 family protein
MYSYLTGNPGRSLFDDFDRLQHELDALFGGGTRASIRGAQTGAFPAINIGATPEEVHVYVFAPGVAATDFELNIQQNVLTVAGRRAPPPDANGTWYLRERFEGSFRRVLALPEDVDPDRIEANCRDGVLHLRIGRREASRPRQIAIN